MTEAALQISGECRLSTWGVGGDKYLDLYLIPYIKVDPRGIKNTNVKILQEKKPGDYQVIFVKENMF